VKGAGNGGCADLAVPMLLYAPGAGGAPGAALPLGKRADQTCLALFFFLHLGRQIQHSGSAGISGTRSAQVPRHAVPFENGTRRRVGRTWEARNTTRNPKLLLRLSG
jgi:hypothetical protein